MNPTRRQFIAATSGFGAVIASARAARAQRPVAPAARPAVIATWDHGLPGCAAAYRILSSGGTLLDALEKGVNVVEDDPTCMSVGYGGLPNEDGVVQLDAAIFDGATHRAGSVAALERIKNPISVARKVMEKTRHVLLAGAGALTFARKMGFKEQDLITPESRARWEKLKGKTDFWVEQHDTVCLLGVDAGGNLASAVSTSGLGRKLAGRVGDSPILGAGSYVDNEVGAAAATGVGEFTLRTCASFAIVERMRAGQSPQRACEDTLDWVMRKIPELRTDARHQLAFIALDKHGRPGAAVVRKPAEKPFKYAFAAGPKAATMVEVAPRVS
jgi:N4-(beta-N-acetylglucosaminyl)-L-asparaginase